MLPKESDLDFEFTLESERSGVVDEPIFQMLVLGDWSGHGGKAELASRRPVEIDRDNFDEVLSGLEVRLRTEFAGELVFKSLDDFHPDAIYQNVPAFAELRELRKRLRNADTFNSAASEMRGMFDLEVERPESQSPAPAIEDGGSLLDAVLSNQAGGANPSASSSSNDLSRLVSDLVRPHLVSVDAARQSSFTAAVDEAAGDLMRRILHDRSFQLLEAAWRGLFFLVRRTQTSSDLKIFILDISKDELTSDLRNADKLENSRLHKLISAGHGGSGWAAVIGNYAFTAGIDDVAALMRGAKICAPAGTPFVSHVRPDLFGVHSLAEAVDSADWELLGDSDEGKLWAALRSIPESKFLGFVMPRFLARLPYGSDTEPTEAFSFEEFTDNASHDDYLWANGCFLVAQLLGSTYTEMGWRFEGRFTQDVEGLPLHVYKRDGVTLYKSSAEVELSQSAAEKMMQHGIMPLVSFKNTDRVRLASFQSVSDPVSALKGRWT